MYQKITLMDHACHFMPHLVVVRIRDQPGDDAKNRHGINLKVRGLVSDV